MLKNRSRLWWAAALIGWSFDLFYWQKPPGISFTLQLLLILGALLILSRQEEKPPVWQSLLLIVPVMVFGSLAFLRAEPFTKFLNHLLSLIFLALLLLSFRGGRWPDYNLGDYLVGGFRLLIHTIALPIDLISEGRTRQDGEPAEREKTRTGWQSALPYLRGMLLALPILAVFAALFSAADPIFASWLGELIELLRIEKLPEYILRFFLIGMWTLITAGLLLYALLKSEQESLLGIDKPWLPHFLGFQETMIVLGSVNMLFLSFVTIQFRYFFGGEKNISLESFTYAEYARRGFGELLAAAFFTLLLLIVLNSISRRSSRRQSRIFTILSGLLTLFIGVILISSHQRLALYEAAYGFTRLRTYAHLCILWIGILFAGVLALEILHKPRYFTLAALGAVAGFVLTMNAVNVDALIARRNILRAARQEVPLDAHYLKRLSSDAVPAIIKLAGTEGLTPEEKQEISAVLVCRALEIEDRERPWQAFLLPLGRSARRLENNRNLWETVQLEQENTSWYADLAGEKFFCGYASEGE